MVSGLAIKLLDFFLRVLIAPVGFTWQGVAKIYGNMSGWASALSLSLQKDVRVSEPCATVLILRLII